MGYEFNYNIPIYIQIVDIIKLDIISGKLKPGDKLPSVRVYANNLKVNPNTMQKAMNELEDLKLIFTERTNGKFVTDDINLIKEFKNNHINNIVNNYFKDMELINVGKREAIKYILEKSDKNEFSRI